MSMPYTPTSNWTNRDLKGRDLQARPLRSAEPVSFASDPATDRLSRRMAEDVRPDRDERPADTVADDDFMSRPMVNASASDTDTAMASPDIFDAPMVNEVSSDAGSEGPMSEAPMADAASSRSHRPEEARSKADQPRAALATSRPVVPDDVVAPAYGAAPRRGGLSPLVMVGAPLGVAAVAAIGWLAMSGGESTAPTAQPTQPLEIAAAVPAADPLINMPVSETGAPVASAALAPVATSTPTPRPARAEPARTAPVRAEPAGAAETAPATATIAPVEPAASTITPEPAPATESVIEPPAPLIATEPLSPQ